MSHNYKTEAEFMKYLLAKLKKENVLTQRIESHSTGNGIPDLFVQGHGDDAFVEVKNVNKDFDWNQLDNKPVKIPYRPGQLAWHFQYAVAHCNLKHAWTIISFNNGVLLLRMTSWLCKHLIEQYNWFDMNYVDWCRGDNLKILAVFFNWKQFAETDLSKTIIACKQ